VVVVVDMEVTVLISQTVAVAEHIPKYQTLLSAVPKMFRLVLSELLGQRVGAPVAMAAIHGFGLMVVQVHPQILLRGLWPRAVSVLP
jgi:hypothetical protein